MEVVIAVDAKTDLAVMAAVVVVGVAAADLVCS